MADTQVTMAGAQLTSWKLIKAKYDGKGDEIAPAKLGISLEVPLARATPHLTRLARMFRNRDELELGVTTLTEQLELADSKKD